MAHKTRPSLIFYVIGILRELDCYPRVQRPRAARKAEDFSRPYGIAFILPGDYELQQLRSRIPVNWSQESVAFSVDPVVIPITSRGRKRTATPRRVRAS